LQAHHKRARAVEPVGQEQTLGWQLAEQSPGQGEFTLALLRHGGGNGCVRAQFHEQRGPKLGKGGVKAAAGRLGQLAEDARSVGTGKARALQPYQT
jgi:hypothetical protein